MTFFDPLAHQRLYTTRLAAKRVALIVACALAFAVTLSLVALGVGIAALGIMGALTL
jgi:hypothetical protein